MINETSHKQIGCYKNGKLHGKLQLWKMHPVNHYVEIDYVDGKQHGQYMVWADETKERMLFVCTFEHGLKEGLCLNWYNDRRNEMFFVHDKKQGKEKEFALTTEGEVLRWQCDYVDGKQTGKAYCFDEQGKCYCEMSYKDDKLHGVCTRVQEDASTLIKVFDMDECFVEREETNQAKLLFLVFLINILWNFRVSIPTFQNILSWIR